MPAPSDQIADNVTRIRERIAAAAARSGRSADDVLLVAVTKYVAADWIRPLVAAGCRDLGESRPQHLWEKATMFSDPPIRWHLIGHLQRNKIRRTLPLTHLIHSVDSPRLLAEIDQEASQGNDGDQEKRAVSVLLEVNVSGESAKHGFAPEAIEPLVERLAEYPNVAVRGLMCMAGLEGDALAARHDFATLRRLRDRLLPRCPPNVSLDELSMGMSGDFEAAIEEGATIVRVGSALFEGIL
jgi:PLP dependent protein